jgi:tRNA uridine 5-carboxymethylaminomethyl modification enzyme
MLEYGKFDNSLTDEDIRHIESEIKYEGYLKRQETEIVRIKKMDKERIPESIDFQEIPGLTREVKEKLEKRRPRTIGEAKKIPGITPAAIVNLHVYLRIQCRKNVPRGTSTGHE